MFVTLLIVCLAVVALIGGVVVFGAFLAQARSLRGRQDAVVGDCEDALRRRRVLLAGVID